MCRASTWDAMLEQEVPPAYVGLSERLHSGQQGRVVFERSSRAFITGRGTKQSDPISPALFNAVHEFALKNVISKRRLIGWGIALGRNPEGLLRALRFADDVLLLAIPEAS